jgi:AcrR family transcriptional regulator
VTEGTGMTEGKSDARLETWIEAGFAEIARTGVEGVRVEVLAKNLGVTKGGFYRRFRDRAALLEAMLQNWRDGRIDAIEKQTSLDGASARERLKALIALYSERMNTEGKNTAGMGIELAIRQWARSDELAASAVASVDAARLKNVGHLYRATGLPAEEADAQAFLFYCFIFGQSLLFLERGPRKRAQLVAKSAEKLIEDEDQSRPAQTGRD